MYKITKSIHIDFAHIVAGHPGACINIHGHTWEFRVTVAARVLNDTGFVIDFGELKRDVLAPVHTLLDHSFALGAEVYRDAEPGLKLLGGVFQGTRTRDFCGRMSPGLESPLGGAINRYPGALKVAVFPFNPTSEKLAEWLYELARLRLTDSRVTVASAAVFETLHPVESYAEFSGD